MSQGPVGTGASWAGTPDDAGPMIGEALRDAGTGRAEEVREHLRERARNDLWFLWHDVLSRGDIDSEVHRDMCARWDARRSWLYTLWMTPRWHLKSAIWTVGGNIQEGLRDPDCRVLISNAVHATALGFQHAIKTAFEKNPKLRWLFPEYKPTGLRSQRWTDSLLEFPCRRHATVEGNYQCLGVEATLVSRHFDVIHVDDAVNDKNVTTPEYREKVWGWWQDLQQLEHDIGSTRRRVIGTCWHYDDMHRRILAEEREERARGRVKWLIYLRMVVEGCQLPARGAQLPPEGRILWPRQLDHLGKAHGYSWEDVQRKRADVGEYKFSCQFMNQPTSPEQRVLRSELVTEVAREDVPDVDWTVAVDLKAKEGETVGTDWNVVLVAGRGSDGRFYVLDVVRGRMDPTGMLDAVIDALRRHGARRVCVEQVLWEHALWRAWTDRARKQGVHLPFKVMERRNTTKVQRILALEPDVSAGRVSIVRGCRGEQALRDEMDQFTVAGSKGHDDVLDALADAHKTSILPTGEQAEGAPPGTYDAEFGALHDLDEEEAEADDGMDELLCNV